MKTKGNQCKTIVFNRSTRKPSKNQKKNKKTNIPTKSESWSGKVGFVEIFDFFGFSVFLKVFLYFY